MSDIIIISMPPGLVCYLVMLSRRISSIPPLPHPFFRQSKVITRRGHANTIMRCDQTALSHMSRIRVPRSGQYRFRLYTCLMILRLHTERCSIYGRALYICTELLIPCDFSHFARRIPANIDRPYKLERKENYRNGKSRYYRCFVIIT